MNEWTPEAVAILRRQIEGWKEVERFEAEELASMTDERAERIIDSLEAVELWRTRPDWSGLVEQQAAFMKSRRQ